MKKRRVQGIDRPRSIELGEFPCLELSTKIPQKDEWPGRGARMLLVSVIAGVDDQGVVHHRATALGHAFHRFHDPHQHAAVVLTDLDPDRIAGLIHVSKVMSLLLDAQSLPGTEDLATT